MKLLHAVPFNNSTLTFYLPKGSYGGFLISYTGTNNATAKTRKNLGSVQLVYQNNPVINVDAEFLSYLADLKGGYITFVSTASSTLNATIFIPAGQFGDTNNSYIVSDKSKFYFKLDFPDLANISGTVSIYGINKLGVQNYIYGMFSRNVVASGASTVSDVHRQSNIVGTYIKSNSSVSTYQLIKDNQVIADASLQDLAELSDFLNRVETSNTLVEIPMNLSKDVREAVSSEIQFKVNFTGATTLEQYFTYLLFTPTEAVLSVREINSNLQAKIGAGLIRDIPRPVLIKEPVGTIPVD